MEQQISDRAQFAVLKVRKAYWDLQNALRQGSDWQKEADTLQERARNNEEYVKKCQQKLNKAREELQGCAINEPFATKDREP